MDLRYSIDNEGASLNILLERDLDDRNNLHDERRVAIFDGHTSTPIVFTGKSAANFLKAAARAAEAWENLDEQLKNKEAVDDEKDD